MNNTNRMSRWIVFLYTGCIILDLLPYGIGTNLIGPSMVDLQYVYDCTFEQISYLASLFALGYLLGSLSGLFVQYVNRQLFIALSLTLQAISLLLMPHCSNYLVLYVAAGVYSFGGGSYDATSTVWLVDLVGEKRCGMLMQLTQFFYAVGMIIGPWIAAPFVYGEKMVTENNVTITKEDRQQHLTLPFFIGFLVQLSVPLVLVAAYLFCPYQEGSNNKPPEASEKSAEEGNKTSENKSGRSKRLGSINSIGSNINRPRTNSAYACRLRSGTLISNASCQPEEAKGEEKIEEEEEEENIPYRMTKLIFATISLGAYGALESSYWSFFASMLQYSPAKFLASEAAAALSMSGIGYAVGRLVAIVLSFWVSSDTLLIGHNILVLASLALLYYSFASYNMLILGTIMLGYSISAIWPALFSFTSYHLRLTDKICTAFSFLSGVLTLLVPFILGDSIQKNPIFLLYALSGCAVISAAAFTIAKVLVVLAPRQSTIARTTQ